MAKILLSENTVLVDKIVGDLPQFKELLDTVKVQYEALDYGPLTDEVFKGLLVNLAHPLLPVDPTTNQQHATQGLNETLRKLIAFKAEIKDNYPRKDNVVLELQYISYIDGDFVVDKTEEIADKYARVYVDADSQTALNNNLNALISELNTLKSNAISLGLSSAGIIDPLGTGLISRLLKVNANGSISINQESLNWALTFKK